MELSRLGYEGGADGVDPSLRARVEAFAAERATARRADDGIFDLVTPLDLPSTPAPDTSPP